MPPGESRHLTSSSLGLNFRQLPPGKSQRKTTAAKSVWRLLVSLQCPFQLDCCHGNPHVSLQIVLIFTHPRALKTQSYQRPLLVTIKTKTTELCGLGLAVSVLFNFLLPRGKRKEKAMATHSSTLAWEMPWMEEPGRLQSMGSLRVGRSWATSLLLFTFMYWRGKWKPTPVFLSGESQGQGSLVGCRLWGCTELDMAEVT